MKNHTLKEFKEYSGNSNRAIARACKCSPQAISDLLKKEHITVVHNPSTGSIAIYDRGLLSRTGIFNNDHRY